MEFDKKGLNVRKIWLYFFLTLTITFGISIVPKLHVLCISNKYLYSSAGLSFLT